MNVCWHPNTAFVRSNKHMIRLKDRQVLDDSVLATRTPNFTLVSRKEMKKIHRMQQLSIIFFGEDKRRDWNKLLFVCVILNSLKVLCRPEAGKEF